MMDPKEYLERLFALKQANVTADNRQCFDDFYNEDQYAAAVTQILVLQDKLMNDWQLKLRIRDILEQRVMIPNGSVGKPYTSRLDFEQLNWTDIVAYEIEGLKDTGLEYDRATTTISGIPLVSGDLKLVMTFRVTGEEEKEDRNRKVIPLVLNPDPKSLWKNKPSDTAALFWKPDDVAETAALGNKHIVVASRRGRSHANVGSYRDDDFAFKHIENCGWSIVAVSDGAGSATFSRQGSVIACNRVVTYFESRLAGGHFNILDQLLESLSQDTDADLQKEISQFVYTELGNGVKYVHKELELASQAAEATLNDFHATLIFVLVKKYTFGYGILSFGVGDCPIGLLYDQKTKVALMNTLDVGEFGGGTRFITMPEIFHSDQFANRFAFKLVKDFDYLMLMTDGIYDPKFEVEANLTRIEKWQSFLDDLNGKNAEEKGVVLEKDNPEIATQLSAWMDFWSPGNHDDRTLAIIF